MKINGMNEDLNLGTHRSAKAPMEGGMTFKGLLDHQMTKVNEPLRSLAPSSGDTRTLVLDQGEKILSLLDIYAADLEDPGKMLKQFEPLVNTIEDEVSRLQKTVSHPSLMDSDLRSLMEELMVTADVAIYKFHRGDFL